MPPAAAGRQPPLPSASSSPGQPPRPRSPAPPPAPQPAHPRPGSRAPQSHVPGSAVPRARGRAGSVPRKRPGHRSSRRPTASLGRRRRCRRGRPLGRAESGSRWGPGAAAACAARAPSAALSSLRLGSAAGRPPLSSRAPPLARRNWLPESLAPPPRRALPRRCARRARVLPEPPGRVPRWARLPDGAARGAFAPGPCGVSLLGPPSDEWTAGKKRHRENTFSRGGQWLPQFWCGILIM